MNIIDDKKVSLIAKLIISYVLLLDIAFLFYVFNTDPSSDQTARGAVFTNLLVWTATLYAPIAAYFFYDSWKEQKNYDLKKNLIEKIIEGVSSTQYSILMRMRYANALTEINKNLIVFKNIESITNIEGQREYHILAYANIAIFEKLTNNEEIRQAYRWYESYSMTLEKFHLQIANIYKDYYGKIEQDLLKDLLKDSDDFTIRHKNYEKNEKVKFKFEIQKMEILMENNEEIKYSGKIPIKYSITYHDLVKDFELKTDELITLLVKQIKI